MINVNLSEQQSNPYVLEALALGVRCREIEVRPSRKSLVCID